MKISFNTPIRKWSVAAAAVALAAAYVGLATSQFAAYLLGNPLRVESTSLTNLSRAARLDPGNADYRYHLGRYYALVASDPASAVGQYKAAVQLNPHSADYWLDLADAYQVMDDKADQTLALENAVHAEPTNPDVARNAANFYLVLATNENDNAVSQNLLAKALREFRVVLANDPSSATEAVRNCWRIEPDVDALLRDVMPPRSEAYLAFLTLLESKEETAGAAKVWSALIESHQSFELRYAEDYFHYLIQHKEVDQAVLVWQQAANRFGLSAYLPTSGNLIVNGSFNLDVLNAGFDWQYQKQDSVRLTLDPGDFHSGRRSLMINFEGPGVVDAGIYQLVAVQPDTTYEFSAFYKNGEMEGAGGPHFTIQDMYTQAIYYDSDELKDAGFWKSDEGEFTTGKDCKLVVLHVRRLPERSPIRGKLWIDDFRLTRKPS